MRLLALDTDASEPDGITPTSVQAQWLQSRLAAATEPWKLVYGHHAPYSSSSRRSSTPALQWPYEAWGGNGGTDGARS